MDSLFCLKQRQDNAVVCESQDTYCAFTHFADIFERTGKEWLMVMYEAYFDDSGTHPDAEIAVGACYVSTIRGWREYVEVWDKIRREEGFDVFHSAEFHAPEKQQKQPYCNWDEAKKNRVFARVAKAINQNKRIGVAVAVPKKVYDGVVPLRIRQSHFEDHYTFAISKCLGMIAKWRHDSQIRLPIQVFFDHEEKGTKKRVAIEKLFEEMTQSDLEHLGLEDKKPIFKSKALFKPLQAADVLAWQMNKHMGKIWPGPDVDEECSAEFMQLRLDQEMDLGFCTEENCRKWVARIEDWELQNNKLLFEEINGKTRNSSPYSASRTTGA